MDTYKCYLLVVKARWYVEQTGTEVWSSSAKLLLIPGSHCPDPNIALCKDAQNRA